MFISKARNIFIGTIMLSTAIIVLYTKNRNLKQELKTANSNVENLLADTSKYAQYLKISKKQFNKRYNNKIQELQRMGYKYKNLKQAHYLLCATVIKLPYISVFVVFGTGGPYVV